MNNSDTKYSNPKCPKEEIDILKSLGFTEFIYWLCDKQIDPKCNEINELYSQFIDLIEEMAQYPLFQGEIMVEFNKVKLELNQYLNPINPFKSQFRFPEPNGFNYEKLNLFMYSIRYDKHDNRVIHIK